MPEHPLTHLKEGANNPFYPFEVAKKEGFLFQRPELTVWCISKKLSEQLEMHNILLTHFQISMRKKEHKMPVHPKKQFSNKCFQYLIPKQTSQTNIFCASLTFLVHVQTFTSTSPVGKQFNCQKETHKS